MEVVGAGVIKQFDKAGPGELVAFQGRTRRHLGIVAAQNADGDPLVGVFEPSDEPHPRLFREDAAKKCLSYGTSWVIEPIHDEDSVPGVRDTANRAGLLVQTTTGWLMSFAASGVSEGGRFTVEWWNLAGGSENVHLPDSTVLFSSWAVWASGEARQDPRSKHLIGFKAKKSQ